MICLKIISTNNVYENFTVKASILQKHFTDQSVGFFKYFIFDEIGRCLYFFVHRWWFSNSDTLQGSL